MFNVAAKPFLKSDLIGKQLTERRITKNIVYTTGSKSPHASPDRLESCKENNCGKTTNQWDKPTEKPQAGHF